MKVKEFVEKYDIAMRYSRGRELVKEYGDAEVLTYAVSKDFGHAFIFKGARTYFAFMNGHKTRLIGKVVEIIKDASFDIQLPDKKLERYAVMKSV